MSVVVEEFLIVIIEEFENELRSVHATQEEIYVPSLFIEELFYNVVDMIFVFIF